MRLNICLILGRGMEKWGKPRTWENRTNCTLQLIDVSGRLKQKQYVHDAGNHKESRRVKDIHEGVFRRGLHHHELYLSFFNLFNLLLRESCKYIQGYRLFQKPKLYLLVQTVTHKSTKMRQHSGGNWNLPSQSLKDLKP